MEKYDNFLVTYGLGTKYDEIELEDLTEDDMLLVPKFLIELYDSVGLSSFMNGFLWTINPKELIDWLNEWLPFNERCIPFARTALGDVLFVRNGEIMLLNSNWGLVDYTIDDDVMFFDHFLTSEQYLIENFNKNIWNELPNKKINPDECFGFTPLLSLGGSEISQNLKKVHLVEYLDIVSKSNDDVTFFDH